VIEASRPPFQRRRIALVLTAALGATAIVSVIAAMLPLRDVGQVTLLASAASVGIAVSGGRPRPLLVLGAIVYVGALEWTYINWIVPIFGYSGLIDVGVDVASYAVVTSLAALPALWLPMQLQRPSAVIIWLLYLLAYVPSIVVPVHLLGPDLLTVLPLELILVIAFAVLGVVGRLPRMAIGRRALPITGFARGVAVIGLVGFAYLLLVFGFAAPPALEDVYERRATYQTVLNAGLGSGYLATWLGNIVYPMLMALGLSRARPSLLILGIAGQIFIYAVSGLKEMLLSVVFVPILYFIIRYGAARFGLILVWGAVSVIAFSVVMTAAGSILALALLVARLIVTPGQLTAYYFDFFRSHDPYLLTHSFLHWFGQPPYAVEPPFLIGRVYLSVVVDANANIWADAMANFGLLGVIPFTIILGAVLWFLDSVAIGRDIAVIGCVIGLGGLALANGALFTSLLTAGVGLTIAVVAVMPRGELRRASSP
jgi:hypothetical protein